MNSSKHIIIEENPIYKTLLDEKIAPSCYCYRTVHSVTNFYVFSALIITACITVLSIFFVFGDRFFKEKYKREFERAVASREGCEGD